MCYVRVLRKKQMFRITINLFSVKLTLIGNILCIVKGEKNLYVVGLLI